MNTLVHEIVVQYKGSISAEHGIGTLKKDALATFKPQNTAIMKSIKSVIDPKNIMNPGKLI